jgi:hypothetical protein
MKYQKDLLIALVEKDEPARFNFKQSESNPVELFYKRHMSSDNPIPQIIVVGILRVLLTTCPNAVRNSGGIDLHHEWSACFEFLFHHKHFFIEHKFKSAHFNFDFLTPKEEIIITQSSGGEENSK